MIRYRVEVKARRPVDADGDGWCYEGRSDRRRIPCPPGTPRGTTVEKLGRSIGDGAGSGSDRSRTTPSTKPRTSGRPVITGRPVRTTRVERQPVNWRQVAPDGVIYRAQRADADYSADPDDAAVYFSGDRDMTEPYGDVLYATTLPDDALDLRQPVDQARLRDAIDPILADLDGRAETLTGAQRTQFGAARRDLDRALQRFDAEPNTSNAVAALANLNIALNRADNPSDPFRPGVAQRAVLDRLDLPAILETDVVDGQERVTVALRNLPPLAPAPVNPRPKRPRSPSPPPLTGAAQDLALEADGDWGRFAELLDERGYVVFDYETTGFEQPNSNQPVQVGAVRIRGGRVVERLNLYMNPGEGLSDWSKANLKDADGNPLSDEWLAQQPSKADVHRQLAEFVGDSILAAHNYPFDGKVLDATMRAEGIDFTPAGTIDTLELARQIVPKTPEGDSSGPDGHALNELTAFFDIPNARWHTADGDSENTGLMLGKALAFAKERNISTDPMDPEWQRSRFEEANRQYDNAMEQFRRDDAAFKDEVARIQQMVRDGGIRPGVGPNTRQVASISDRPEIEPDGPADAPESTRVDDADLSPEDRLMQELDRLVTERRRQAAARAADIAERAKGFRSEAQMDAARRWSPDMYVEPDFEDYMQEWERDNPEPDPDDYEDDDEFEEDVADWQAERVDAYTMHIEDMLSAARDHANEIFDGVVVGKDGTAYGIEVTGVEFGQLEYEGALKFSGDLYTEDGRRVGGFERTLWPDGAVYHDHLKLTEEFRDAGIASAFNARNEGFYRAMGYDRITVEGYSNRGEYIGATHWPRNGFDWDDEAVRDDFHAEIRDAIDFYDSQAERGETPTVSVGSTTVPLFSSLQERNLVEALLDLSDDSDFDDENRLVAADLLHWSGAQQWFQRNNARLKYRRQL